MMADSQERNPKSQDSGNDWYMDESADVSEFSFLTDKPASDSAADADRFAVSDSSANRRHRRRLIPQHIRRIKLASTATPEQVDTLPQYVIGNLSEDVNAGQTKTAPFRLCANKRLTGGLGHER